MSMFDDDHDNRQTGAALALAQDTGMVQALARAEIDQQIATAHQFPRSLTRVTRNITGLVTISQEAAAECNYALPRGGKTITGPSIRLAEVVASQWGNCRVASRVTVIDRRDKFIEAEALFHDLETNAAVLKRVRTKIASANGQIYNDDMITMTGNAAQSKAMRNAIFAGVPKAVWGRAYNEALALVKGDMKTLPERRKAALSALGAFGITPAQVCEILSVAGEADIGLDQLVQIGGFVQALKTEETTVDDLLAAARPESEKHHAGVVQRIEQKPQDRMADAMMQMEAERAAAKRQQEALEKQIAEKELASLRMQYETETGEKPDGRWGVETLREKIAAALAGDNHDGDEDANEGGQQPEQGGDEQPAPGTETETPHDPETGEVIEEDPAPTTKAPDRAQFEHLFNTIVNDLIDASAPDEVADLYAPQIEAMKTVAPDLHERLLNEIAAAKE